MSDQAFYCPDCGTRYKWRSSFVGRELHCRCGCSFLPPTELAGEEEDATPVAASAFSVTTSPVQRALEEGEFETKPPTFTDWILPSILLAAGFPLGAWVTWLITGKLYLWLACTGALIVGEIIVGVPVMLGALMLGASWFQEAFGELHKVLFKIAAVTLGTGMICDPIFAYAMTNIHLFVMDMGGWHFLYVGGFGGGLAIYMLLQGLPAWIMFGTHPAMIGSVVLINFLPRFAIFFAAYYGLQAVWP